MAISAGYLVYGLLITNVLPNVTSGLAAGELALLLLAKLRRIVRFSGPFLAAPSSPVFYTL